MPWGGTAVSARPNIRITVPNPATEKYLTDRDIFLGFDIVGGNFDDFESFDPCVYVAQPTARRHPET